MSESNSSRFKISFDEETPSETKVQEEIENLRIEKLKQRINLLAFLLPCLIGATVLFGYLDITKKFDTVYSSGSTDVQTLSKTMESQFSSLSIRQAKLESLLLNKTTAFENTLVALKIKLDKTEKTIADSTTSSKTDTQDLETKIADIDKSSASVKAEINKLTNEINTLEKEVKNDMSKLAGSFVKFSSDFDKIRGELNKLDQIKQLKSDISSLSSAKTDKMVFELTIQHQEKLYQQKLDLLKKNLDEQLETIHNKITSIESKQKELSTKGSALQEKPSTPPKVSGPKMSPPPGGISEKDIR